jgi:LysM repeat protein
MAEVDQADEKEGAAQAEATQAAVLKAAQKEAEKEAEAEEPVLTAEHKVGRGQTLSQVASMYHTSVDDLKKMNGITDAHSVQAGQVLKVKASGSEIVAGATVGRTYKAKPGDTLWTIAKSNDTSVETLKRLNPKLESKGLRIGDTIKVPSSGSVAVASRKVEADESPKSAKKPEGKTVASKSSSKSASAKSASAKTSTRTAKASPKKESYRSHRVQKGQTLTSIAERYKTSVDTLKRINGIRDAKSVQTGKTLKVPL